MTYTLCVVGACARPVTDNALACRSCGAELHQALTDIADDDGLAAELYAALARQARLGGGGRRSAETPLPYGEAAGEAIWVLHTTLVSWVLVLLSAERRPAEGPICRAGCLHGSCRWIRTFGHPAETLPAMAAWLADRTEDLRRHPDAAAAVDELTDAVRQACQAIDRPADRVYCGPCGRKQDDGIRCLIDLYARPGVAIIQCRCGAIWDIRRRRDWLMAEAENVLGTATEIARAVTSLGRPVTPDRIWQWAHRGRLLVRRHGSREQPLYRVGDVLDLLDAAITPIPIGPVCVRRCEHRTCRLIRTRAPKRAHAS